jgi:hypothetical protein
VPLQEVPLAGVVVNHLYATCTASSAHDTAEECRSFGLQGTLW